MHEYRVEKVEEIPCVSHGDFLFRAVRVDLRRLEDNRQFRAKFKRGLGLKAGDVVRLSKGTVFAPEGAL
jgi:hypothetical protein